MSTLFYGSICLTDMINEAKAQHSAFMKAQNGKIYANIRIWLNDEPDKFGNTISLQLNSSKEKKDVEQKIYIGNAKKSEMQEPKPVTASDVKDFDDLPF